MNVLIPKSGVKFVRKEVICDTGKTQEAFEAPVDALQLIVINDARLNFLEARFSYESQKSRKGNPRGQDVG
ncbi:MAG: hypothetical protein ACREX3_25920 [Gammaproteobacteria bacterium]